MDRSDEGCTSISQSSFICAVLNHNQRALHNERKNQWVGIDAWTAVLQLHNIETDKRSNLSWLNPRKKKKSLSQMFVDVIQTLLSSHLWSAFSFLLFVPCICLIGMLSAFCSAQFWTDCSVCCYLLICLRAWLAAAPAPGFEPASSCGCLPLYWSAKKTYMHKTNINPVCLSKIRNKIC